MWVSDLVIIFGAIAAVLTTAHFALLHSVELARRLGWSEAMIGMTVVSVGTSLPEVVTHLAGSARILRDPDLGPEVGALVIGTNVGSDVFQQTFLLALVALVGTIAVEKKRLPSDGGGLVGAAALLLAFCFDGRVQRWEGGVLVLAYVLFVEWQRRTGRLPEGPEPDNGRPLWQTVLGLLVAFGVMAWAAEVLVDHSVQLARTLAISTSFFGVVLLGLATSFPEVVTALLGVRQGRARISAGVLIGSNVTNPTLALGAGALVSEYPVPGVVVQFDLPAKLATAVLVLVFLRTGAALGKWEATVLIALYVLYLGLRLSWYPTDF